jgi:hypothetical protein
MVCRGFDGRGVERNDAVARLVLDLASWS